MLVLELIQDFMWAKAYPEYLGSAEYMTLYNEALLNDDPTAKPLYTAEQIYNHGSGLNPYRYPNINYYSSDYVKKAYNRSEVTAEITGGGKRARSDSFNPQLALSDRQRRLGNPGRVSGIRRNAVLCGDPRGCRRNGDRNTNDRTLMSVLSE